MERPKTVVDYEAWEKGYLPPTEHVLIDALSYRGARVKFSSDHGDDGAFWLVVRGRTIKRDSMRKVMDLLFDCWEEPEKADDKTKEMETAPLSEVEHGEVAKVPAASS